MKREINELFLKRIMLSIDDIDKFEKKYEQNKVS